MSSFPTEFADNAPIETPISLTSDTAKLRISLREIRSQNFGVVAIPFPIDDENSWPNVRLALQSCAEVGLKARLQIEYSMRGASYLRSESWDVAANFDVQTLNLLTPPFAITSIPRDQNGELDWPRAQNWHDFQTPNAPISVASRLYAWTIHFDETRAIDALSSGATQELVSSTRNAWRAVVSPELRESVRGVTLQMPSFWDEDAPDSTRRFPWSDEIAPRFLQLFGAPIGENLASLVADSGQNAVAFRQNFWETATTLLRENFIDALTNWARESQTKLQIRFDALGLNRLVAAYGDVSALAQALVQSGAEIGVDISDNEIPNEIDNVPSTLLTRLFASIGALSHNIEYSIRDTNFTDATSVSSTNETKFANANATQFANAQDEAPRENVTHDNAPQFANATEFGDAIKTLPSETEFANIDENAHEETKLTIANSQDVAQFANTAKSKSATQLTSENFADASANSATKCTNIAVRFSCSPPLFSWQRMLFAGAMNFKTPHDNSGAARSRLLHPFVARHTEILRSGRVGARVGMLWPQRSAWAHHHPKGHRLVRWVEEDLALTADWLDDLHFDWIFLEESTILDAQIEDRVLDVAQSARATTVLLCGAAKIALEAVVLPSVTCFSRDAWAKLEEFANRGGKIICLGLLPRWSEIGRDEAQERHLETQTRCILADVYDAYKREGAELSDEEMRAPSSVGYPILRQTAASGRIATYQPRLNTDRADARLRVRPILTESVAPDLETQARDVRYTRRISSDGETFWLWNARAETQKLNFLLRPKSPQNVTEFDAWTNSSTRWPVWMPLPRDEGGGLALTTETAANEVRILQIERTKIGTESPANSHESVTPILNSDFADLSNENSAPSNAIHKTREDSHGESANFAVESFDGEVARGTVRQSGIPMISVRENQRLSWWRGENVRVPSPILLDEWENENSSLQTPDATFEYSNSGTQSDDTTTNFLANANPSLGNINNELAKSDGAEPNFEYSKSFVQSVRVPISWRTCRLFLEVASASLPNSESVVAATANGEFLGRKFAASLVFSLSPTLFVDANSIARDSFSKSPQETTFSRENLPQDAAFIGTSAPETATNRARDAIESDYSQQTESAAPTENSSIFANATRDENSRENETLPFASANSANSEMAALSSSEISRDEDATTSQNSAVVIHDETERENAARDEFFTVNLRLEIAGASDESEPLARLVAFPIVEIRRNL